MALGAMLKDRARITRTVETDVRIEGGYQKKPVEGPWFRCAYIAGDESEARTPGGVRRRNAGIQLVAGRRATDGSLIDLRAGDAVEIDSKLHGTLRMDVVGKPEPIGRRRRIGWIARLGKTDRKAPG